MLQQDQDNIIINSGSKKKNLNIETQSNLSHQSRKRIIQKKKNENICITKNNENDECQDNFLKPISSNFYFNITTDGLKHMDYICHLNDDDIDNITLERQLRPISGLRNRLKRNAYKYDANIFEETDLINRISKIQSIKRLDMSYNDLNIYPKPLCDLIALETLNLSNNKLQDIPMDFEKHQNLIEIILDSNQLKAIPKSIMKFKKLVRLSIRNNLITNLKNIEHLRKLRYFIADNNSITRLDDLFENIDKLELLDFKYNSINYIETNILKNNFNFLKQMDLSFNKLQYIPSELLMLPQLEILNISNNLLTKLPILPVTFKRALEMHSIDISSNFLTKFNEYLISLAYYVDLSSNKINSLPSATIKSLSIEQLENKILKLDGNPLYYPSYEVCVNGLKVIKQFFEEASAHIQLNHGFKMILIGDSKCGKTSLAYAIEDYHAQLNIEKIEQKNEIDLGVAIDTQTLEKFIEVHEFFLKMDTEKMNKIINASSNKIICEDPKNLVTTMAISLYDISGSLDQYGHLTYFFIDKTALIILTIDITTFDESLSSDVDKAEKNLKSWLDMLLFKMSRTCNFYLLIVANKCDLYFSSTKNNIYKEDTTKLEQNISAFWYENCIFFSKNTRKKLKTITSKILNKVNEHFESRLNFVNCELEKIKSLSKISASQSDRLKSLTSLYNYCKPGIHDIIPIVSTVTMHGIDSLNETIKSIVCKNKTFFPNVNKKIPSLWLEAEKYVFSKFNRFSVTKIADYSARIFSNSLNSISSLCIDFEEFKERITEKYGMDHMIFDITNYLNSQGKILWLQDPEIWSSKVFLRPNTLFDLLHALFRPDFDVNFTDNHLKVVRAKLSINNSNEEVLQELKKELLNKGCAYVELLKLIWLPIIFTDSLDLLNELIILFMAFFNIGYPQVPKSKIKKIFENYSEFFESSFKNMNQNRTNIYMSNKKIKRRDLSFRSQSRTSNVEEQSNNTTTEILDSAERHNSTQYIQFDCIMIPFYMPKIKNEERLNEIRQILCTSAINLAITMNNCKESKLKIPHVCLKYTFPWGLVKGFFERFSVNCIINTELYYKMHFKDAVYGYNEQNTIGFLTYLKELNDDVNISEIYFEFYIVGIHFKERDDNDFNNNLNETSSKIDYENFWGLIMRVLVLFEDMLLNLPGMTFQRSTQCPDCRQYTFFGEWMTPKELQGLKFRKCISCEKDIDAIYLVKPNNGKNLAMELKKLKQRLENIIQKRTESALNKSGSINFI